MFFKRYRSAIPKGYYSEAALRNSGRELFKLSRQFLHVVKGATKRCFILSPDCLFSMLLTANLDKYMYSAVSMQTTWTSLEPRNFQEVRTGDPFV